MSGDKDYRIVIVSIVLLVVECAREVAYVQQKHIPPYNLLIPK